MGWPSTASLAFKTEALARGFTYRRNTVHFSSGDQARERWPPDHELRHASSSRNTWHVMLEYDGALVAITRLPRDFTIVDVAATSVGVADELTAAFGALYDDEPAAATDEGTIWFSYHGGNSQDISCPQWSEIASDYPAQTRQQLDSLMARTVETPDDGRLIIFGGTGLGKTEAIRSLARRWKDWCSPAYVVDPLGTFAAGQAFVAMVSDTPLLHSGSGARGFGQRQLLIAEDCDDLVRRDARTRMPTAFRRLLNLTDGLLAAGSGAYVLVTTTEPLSELDPALLRPGRLLTHVTFDDGYGGTST